MLSEASTLGLTRALVVIALVWHGFCGLLLVMSLGQYRSAPVAVGGWLLITALVIVAARRPAERQTTGAVLGGQLLMFLAAVAVIAVVPAGQQTGTANWVVGDIGWPLAVLAIHRPLREYLIWNAGVILVVLAGVLAGPGLDTNVLGKSASILLCALVLQVGTLVAHGVLGADTARAEAAVRELTRIKVSRGTLAAADRERERWRREIGAALRPLVAGLAAGTVDPAGREVRARCAIEASRLRAAITVLGETGEHSVWRRGVVEALTRAALARGSTLDVRITPEFGAVADVIRGELINTALATTWPR
jgi:hypothetical protein